MTGKGKRTIARHATDQPHNAWIIQLGKEARLEDFSVTVNYGFSGCQGVNEKDAFLIIQNDPEENKVIAIARVYRKRSTIGETTFYFDGILPIEPGIGIKDLGFPAVAKDTAIVRIDWAIFEHAFKKVCGLDYASFPSLLGDKPKEQAYIRELLQYAVADDLLGPANGPEEEIVGMSVRDRYLVGKLAPIEKLEHPGHVEQEDETSESNADYEFDRYTGHHQPGEEFASVEGRPDPEDDSSLEIDASKNQSLVPSSIGFTFCVDATVDSIEVYANWGRYVRGKSDQIDERTGKSRRAWKRIPSGGITNIALGERVIQPIAVDKDCPTVFLQGTISAPLTNGDRLVTLFLVNAQIMPGQNQDQAWVFQPEMIVRAHDGRGIFRRRPVLKVDGEDDERESLEMIYRHRVEFAVGHGVSVRAITAEGDSKHAVEIRTSIMPYHEIPVTETPGMEDGDRPAMKQMIIEGFLDMERLAQLDRNELTAALNILTDDYAAWINEQRGRIGEEIKGYDQAATVAIDRCQEVLERLREGVLVLGSDDKALEAFRFANRAMASQRIHSIYALANRRGEEPGLGALNTRNNRSWRPFQLAFILLSIPALADPHHQDRTEPLDAQADLLWFPTGGGKTEAYLGVAAFTMAIRRLQGKLGGFDAGRGLAVIMRYTLRMLTLQQFQRATALICAMEVIRRSAPETWGQEPFSIGLWVGVNVTPNTTEESHNAIEKEREGTRGKGATPAQLNNCPWCGSEIQPGRDIHVDRDIGRTISYCGDKYSRCEFSKAKSPIGLPVIVVDEEIYRRPPSMLIATVDKFALMAWRSEARTLFGRVEQECVRHGLTWPESDCNGNHQKKGALPRTTVRQVDPIRPPDLIIQDEFHLISGPLGTMVGLYETAVDELSTWDLDGKSIKPKVIASTATVRKAEEQINNVFLRKAKVFPPHGLDVEDNFFSVQRSVEKKPGRRYIGICSPGSSRPAVLIRVYVALLTAAQSLFEQFGQAADPYMTVVGYFNSLRELGGMKRLSEDDVQTRSYRVRMSDVARPGLSQRSIRNVDELTSRVTSKEIPKKLDQLEVKFKPTWIKGETQAIDIVLATNMFSVGVDVNRLGLMVMNGQPKNTAEYIQATSRVGRVFPGLVLTVLTWSRPRDLSHYESFEHYHATFYSHVEAQSVTPFAARALDRGLTGAMVSILRLNSEVLNPNLGAQELNSTANIQAEKVKREVSERAWKVTNKVAVRHNANKMIADRIDQWVKAANKPGRRLGYETRNKQGDVAALLKKPGVLGWDEFTVPMSMREVEPGVQLVMDASILPDPPMWVSRVIDPERSGGKE